MNASQLYDVIQILMEGVNSEESALAICKYVYRLKKEYAPNLIKADIMKFNLFQGRCCPLCKRYHSFYCINCPLRDDVTDSNLCCRKYKLFKQKFYKMHVEERIKDNPAAMKAFLALCDKIESLPEN